MTTPQRLFIGVSIAALGAVAVYIAATRSKIPSPSSDEPRAVEFISEVPGGPLVIFRNISSGSLFGRVAVEPLPLRHQRRLISPISCERLHYAAGWGVCMITDETQFPVRRSAYVFDRAFRRHSTIPLTGPPIRARVSPGGRRAALTVFESGHSYADAMFSTRTIIIDVQTGRRLADLEDLPVLRDGRPFKAVDFNFWGVTFAPGDDEFFATLKSGGMRYLVRGSVDAQQMSVVRTDVECPSLSPDGKRIAFKKSLEAGIGWRLHVIDLQTGAEHALNQTQPSVDDQVEWLDNDQVMYQDSSVLGTGTWVLPIDGVTGSRLLLPDAFSPAVVR